MSKLADALRERKVYNTWGLLSQFSEKGQDVACGYYPPDGRCGGSVSRVFSPSHDTDPDAAWYDNKQKAFHGPQKESFPQALKWADERYGIMVWAPCPFDRSTRIPLTVRKKAEAFARERSK